MLLEQTELSEQNNKSLAVAEQTTLRNKQLQVSKHHLYEQTQLINHFIYFSCADNERVQCADHEL